MTEIDVDLVGLPAMTKKELVSVALKHGGFATPSLNDTLYLHFKGYRRIQNLDEFTGLKSIWLHSNGFGKIENLSHLTELRCLFLQSNCIATIENLEGLNSLVQLDLSENNIRFVQGLSHLPQLTTLNLSKNTLKDAESISHLQECKALSSLDLSKNDLAGEDIVDCLAGISKLTSLNMAGNPAVSKVAFFRKKMIVASETLRYLDRPVEDHERTAVKAWAVGGVEAETKAKEEWVQANKEKQRLGLAQFREWKSSIKSDSPPRHFIAGPELPPREDLDGIVSYCEKLKTAYQSKEEEVGVAVLQDPGTEQVGIAALDEESVSTSIPFIEVISESVCPNPEKKVVFEENSMASGQKEPSSPEGMSIQDEDEMGAEVFNVKRIRDSIAIMKQSNSTKMTMVNTGWTQEMDEFLINKAEEYGYDFEAVAAGMAEQFDLAGVEQTADVCERRFSLIDLPVQADSVNELSVSEVLNFPSSDKPLASFMNENGSRKTIDQLRRDSEPVSISPLSLPTCTYDDMESDEGPERALGRREIIDSIESSHEQKSSL